VRIDLAPLARRQFASQIQDLVDRHAHRAAARLKTRVMDFLKGHLARFPRAGRPIPYPNTHETWIPRTPYVVIYRINDDRQEIVVLALFHVAQDRSRFEP
jgi:plasmid stabilization system protein ParE